MWRIKKIILIWLFVGLMPVQVLAGEDHEDADHKHADDDTSSRLIWRMMDLYPYLPPEELPHGNGVSEIQMVGRILAGAATLKYPIKNHLNDDFEAVIKSARWDNGWSENGSGDEWNNAAAVESWKFGAPELESAKYSEYKSNCITEVENGTEPLTPICQGSGVVSITKNYCDTVANCDSDLSNFFQNGTAEVVIYSNAERVIVSFRGSEPKAGELGDFILDGDLKHEMFRGVEFHLGFLTYYKLLKDDIKNWLDLFNATDKHIYFTGHSLGGAAATIAIFDFAKDSYSKQYKYLPTHHTIGAPPVVYCKRRELFSAGFVKLYERCDPLADQNVGTFLRTKVRAIDGGTVKESPLRRHLNGWVNVRDPAPFAFTPKKDALPPYNPEYSHVGAIHEMYLGPDDLYLSSEAPWTIKTYQGNAWSKYPTTTAGKILLEKQRFGIELALHKYHDQAYYAEGLEHRSGVTNRWFTPDACPTKGGKCSVFHQYSWATFYHSDLHSSASSQATSDATSTSGATSSTSSNSKGGAEGGAGSISSLTLLFLAAGLCVCRRKRE